MNISFLNKKKSNIIIILIILISLGYSCQDNNRKVDISEIDINIDVAWFYKDIFAFAPDSVDVKILHEKYGDFFELYNQKILLVGKSTESGYNERISNFFKYCIDNKILNDVQKKFNNTDTIVNDLTTAFKYYKYHFPQKKIPKINFVISGFNHSVFTDKDVIGVSLDKYLGTNYPLYENLAVQHYMRRKMNKDMISIDIMRGWAITEFQYNDSLNTTLLNKMIFEGRIQYFLNAMLPNKLNHKKLGYTKNQYEWAEKNENNIYSFIIESKILYSTNSEYIRTYINDGPFTSVFSANSAPRAAAWIGYKIVESYMNNNPDITLSELMNINDYQEIFSKAKYKP